MSNLPTVITEALENKSLASRFSHGRFFKDMKWAAERQFALQIIGKSPKLQQCNPETVATSMLDVAFSGLSLSPSLAHGYLIPYGSVCTFSPGYRGLMHLAYKAGTLKSAQVNLVYSNDIEFRVWTDEDGRHIMHREAVRAEKRGDITHAYSLANLMSGPPTMIEVMGPEQLAAVEWAATHKPGGDLKPDGGMVWKGPFRSEMCRKAVFRRQSKFLPKDDGGYMEHMMSVADRFDGNSFDEVEPDTEAPEQELCVSLDQITELNDLLLEHGIKPDVVPVWLGRYAKAIGYSSIENMPARLFAEAKRALSKRVDEVVAQRA